CRIRPSRCSRTRRASRRTRRGLEMAGRLVRKARASSVTGRAPPRSWASSARRGGAGVARETAGSGRARWLGSPNVTNRRGARQALRGVPSGPARTHARAAEDLLQLPGQGRLEPEAASILGMGDLQPLGMEEEPLQPPPRPRLAVEGEIAVLPVAR